MLIDLTTVQILLLTAVSLGLELAIAGVLLDRRGLFHWASAGFWSWAAFLLYFVLTPLSVVIGGDTSDYHLRMTVGGGSERGLWILFVAGMGIATYFLVYLRSKPTVVTWRLSRRRQQWTLLSLGVLGAFVLFGAYSLLTFRTGLVGSGGEKLIVQGRFVGDVTGYQNTGYIFLFAPMLCLMLARWRRLQTLGIVFGSAFFVLSLPHAWSRYATVSILIAASIVLASRRKTKWPNLALVGVIIALMMVFQLRGHTYWEMTDSIDNLASLAAELPSRSSQVLAESDTAMLATWYVSSYRADTLIGYNYGLPLVNYVLTGWVPSRILPQKYFLIDSLSANRAKNYPLIIDQVLYGAKSSLLGSFYDNGGWVGVLLGMALVGFLFRKIDGMLLDGTPVLPRAVGSGWLAVLWIVWGSSNYWGLQVMGSMAIPALLTWLVLPKLPRLHGIPLRANRILPRSGNKGEGRGVQRWLDDFGQESAP